MERLTVVQERMGQAQEKRVAKALLEGPDYQWSKNPQGWTCCTPSGGVYLVTERGECSCMDHVKTCAGSELRCKHVTALRFKLLAESPPPPAAKPKGSGLPLMTDAEFEKVSRLWN